jgi:hypothetical protein
MLLFDVPFRFVFYSLITCPLQFYCMQVAMASLSGSEDSLWESCDDSDHEHSPAKSETDEHLNTTASTSKHPASTKNEPENAPELRRSILNAVPQKLKLDVLAEYGLEGPSDRPSLEDSIVSKEALLSSTALLLRGDDECRKNQLFRAVLTYAKVIQSESQSKDPADPANATFRKAISKIAQILHEKLVDVGGTTPLLSNEPESHESEIEDENETTTKSDHTDNDIETEKRPPPPPRWLTQPPNDGHVLDLEHIVKAANKIDWVLGRSAVEVLRTVADYCEHQIHKKYYRDNWRVQVCAASLYHRLLLQKDIEFDFVRDEEMYLVKKLGKILLNSWPWDNLKEAAAESIPRAEGRILLQRFQTELEQSEDLDDLKSLSFLGTIYLERSEWRDMRIQGEDILLRLYKILLRKLGHRDAITKRTVRSLTYFYGTQGLLLEASSILEEVLLNNPNVRTVNFDSSANIDWDEARKTGGEDVLIQTETLDTDLVGYIEAYYPYQGQLMSLGATSGSNVYWRDSRLYLRQIGEVEFQHRSYEDPSRFQYGIGELEDSSICLDCPYVSYETFQESAFWRANLTYVDVLKGDCTRLLYGSAYQFDRMMQNAKQRDCSTEVKELLIENAEMKVFIIPLKVTGS